MMGAGKTTLGEALASVLQLPFLDLDALVEQQEAMPVSEIFRIKGEAYFRQAEAEALRLATASFPAFVMATGGGTPCFFENMHFIKTNGLCVWLNPPVPELAKRLAQHEVAQRPVLQQKKDQQLAEHLQQLLQQREPFYKQAQVQLTNFSDGIAKNVKQITEILRTIPKHQKL